MATPSGMDLVNAGVSGVESARAASNLTSPICDFSSSSRRGNIHQFRVGKRDRHARGYSNQVHTWDIASLSRRIFNLPSYLTQMAVTNFAIRARNLARLIFKPAC